LGNILTNINNEQREHDAPPSSLMDSTANLKVKTTKGEGVGAHSLTRSTLGVEGHAGAWRWDYEDWQAIQLFTQTCTNQTSWLVHNWNTWVHGRTTTNMNWQDSSRPRLEGSHHFPPYSRFSATGVWIPATMRAHNFACNLWLRWSLKQSCSSRQKLSNGMWHATYTQGNQGNS